MPSSGHWPPAHTLTGGRLHLSQPQNVIFKLAQIALRPNRQAILGGVFFRISDKLAWDCFLLHSSQRNIVEKYLFLTTIDINHPKCDGCAAAKGRWNEYVYHFLC